MVKRIPPLAGPEKDTLLVSINRHRDVVLWKLQGLDEEQARRPLTPSGTNLLSLLKHLSYVEYGWFCGTFGRETEQLGDPEDDLNVGPDETIADMVALYGRARAAADLAVHEVGLDGLGTSWDGETVSMRWVLVHMIEETARHAGHMDIVRELIDGATGDHAGN
ncbi:DinB family protein [Streptomyces sp. NPDC050738]|uniref:DinB family protein n=1 Tax=Streptomyces sp. NPDC050738 TaxID=3154744 RepID=UPI0034168778